MNIRTFATSLALLLTTSTAHAALTGGQLKTATGDVLPLIGSHADIDITGDIATVTVTQRFFSPGALPVNAGYMFPLPHDAAVFAMTMHVGDEVVRAQIMKIGEAKKTFETAKRQGKTASLLQERRANVFTQDVANIPPESEVKIVIEYAQTVPMEDGHFALHFPMVVASRYDNRNGVNVPELSQRLPAGGYHKDGAASAGKGHHGRRVGVRVHIDAGMPIAEVKSKSHRIEMDILSAGRREIFLAAGKVADDRDFVLEYELGKERFSAGLIAHKDDRGGFFTMLVQPPKTLAQRTAPPRELVFVIDASCSMGGAPLDTSKQVMNKLLDGMRGQDTYRIIVFGSDAHSQRGKPVFATPKNIRKTKAWLRGMGTMGGTEIEAGIRAALKPKLDRNRTRTVVFFTDGYIGNEASVVGTIHKHRKDARIFAFGIGNSVNRYLIEEMATAGRGVGRVVTMNEDLDEVADKFAARISAPALTNAWIDWGDLDVTDVTPSGTFNVHLGAPKRIMGRLPTAGFGSVTRAHLVGEIAGKEIRIPIELGEGRYGKAGAIPVLWARTQVEKHMRLLARSRDAAENKSHVDAITDLGLKFALTTRWTAFVAVAERKVEQKAVAGTVPLPAAAGSSAPAASYASKSSFSGHSTPEPAEWAAMLMLLMMAAALLRRKQA